jgi:response regulator RpfG family c-di-GMP phosphodiesterase
MRTRITHERQPASGQWPGPRARGREDGHHRDRAAAGEVLEHRETILIVDDEPAMLEATARILRQYGYATLEAGTSEEALLLAAGDMRLLLTDSVLPRTPGVTLARQMAKLQPGLVIQRIRCSCPGR